MNEDFWRERKLSRKGESNRRRPLTSLTPYRWAKPAYSRGLCSCDIYANSSMSVLGVYELTYSCASILFLLCTLSVYVCVIHHVCLCQSVILKPLLTICVPVLNRAWTAATVQRELITTANHWRSVTTYFLGHIRNQVQCTVGLKWDQKLMLASGYIF